MDRINRDTGGVRELLKRGEDFAFAQIVNAEGSSPGKPGAWLVMMQDGTCAGTVGGGLLEAEVQQQAREVLRTKEAKLLRFSLTPEQAGGLDMRCGGEAEVRIDYVDASRPEQFPEELRQPKPVTAHIFGAGHIGYALEPLLRYTGFRTVVIDDRADFASRERFPEADKVCVINSFAEDWRIVPLSAGQRESLPTKMGTEDFVVIVTRGHAGDLDVLRQALRTDAGYIGMIGSKSKTAECFRKLQEEGYEQASLDRVYAPIGLPIHSRTPEEIAVSICAEMIAVRAGLEARKPQRF